MTICIGDQEGAKKYIIPREFACYFSPVLKAAFNSNFIEGQTQNYRFTDTNEKAGCLLIQWLLTQKVGIYLPDDKGENLLLCQLYVLADHLLIPKLKNEVLALVDSIHNLTNLTPTYCIEYVWKNTMAGSGLRRLFLTYCALRLRPTYMAEYLGQFPKEMLVEFAVFVAENFVKLDRGRKHGNKHWSLKDYQEPEEE